MQAMNPEDFSNEKRVSPRQKAGVSFCPVRHWHDTATANR
jgi:hypothetical protein